MTKSVADKTPIFHQTWRRHTDPPGLWILVITGSVAVHVLLFWLMRSTEFAGSQQHVSNAVPIEFMEISPKARAKARPQSKAKPVSPNSRSTTRKSVSTHLPKQVTPENFTAKSASIDRSTIAFTNNKQAIMSQKSEPSLPQKFLKRPNVKQKIKLFQSKPIKKLDFTPKLASIPSPVLPDNIQTHLPPVIPDNIQPTHIPHPHTPVHKNPKLTHISHPHTPIHKNPEPNHIPQTQQTSVQRNSEPTPFNSDTNTLDQHTQALGEQNQTLPLPNTTTTPTDTSPKDLFSLTQPQESLSPQVKNGEAIGEAPKNQIGETPRTATPHPPKKLSQTPTRSGIVATWSVEAFGVQKDRPENLAKPIGNSREKDLSLLSLNSQVNKPTDFQASLIIDNKGNLIDVIVNPTIPEPQRTQYRKYAQEVFQTQKFIPATSSNGDKPPLSNLVVRITIQPKFH